MACLASRRVYIDMGRYVAVLSFEGGPYRRLLDLHWADDNCGSIPL